MWWFLSCQTEVSLPVEKEEPLLSVLLITIDTLRADRIGAYGDPLAQTPIMDALASEGVLFREAHSVTPLTLPSHASILTGLLPREHGLRDNAGFRLSEEVDTIAEAVQENGHHTAAFVSAFVLDSAWGLDQGFQVYRDPFHPMDVAEIQQFGELELPSVEVVNAAVAWWKNTTGPKFSWVHLYDPHEPWAPPIPWEGDPYRGEVHYVDTLLGRLIDGVGDETMIILTSDHGESLWEGGEREHGMLIHRAVTRVPLIVRLPDVLQTSSEHPVWTPVLDLKQPPGTDLELILGPVPDDPKAAHVVETAVSGIDIAPTIADYLGIDFSSSGRSLLPALKSQALSEVPVYSETLFPSYHFGFYPLRAMQNKEQRYEDGEYTVSFNWRTGEKLPPLGEDLILLTSFFGESIPLPGQIEGNQADALAALGYLSDTIPLDLETAPDPRSKMAILSRLHIAEALAPNEAIPLLEDILQDAPGLIDAHLSLSLKLSEIKEQGAALEHCQLILEQYPNHSTALNNAAILAQSMGESVLSLGYATHLQSINPKDVRGYRIEASIHVKNEEPQQVIRVATQGLAVSPEDPNLHYLLALAYVFEAKPSLAIPSLLAAKQFGSRANDISLWLAIATERTGDIDGAMILYEKAAQEMVGDLRPWVMGGVMLVKAKRCEDAEPFLINAAHRGAIADPNVQSAVQKCNIRL